MHCLNYANVSLHPSASIGHMCENLFTLVTLGIWYDKFNFLTHKVVVARELH